jgi:hypothetical protein
MYTGPNISDNGLVLCLDAANVKSYVSGSTVWKNLTRSGNNGTLINGPTFDFSNLGSIVFDGVDDYIGGISNPTITNQLTMNVWCNMDTSNIISPYIASAILGREFSYRIIMINEGISFAVRTANNFWYTPGTFVDGIVQSNTWFNASAIYDGTQTLLYINGALVGTGGSPISGNILTGGSGNFSIMGNIAVNLAYGKGLVSTAQIYNRALSSEEILQNYEGLKSRYGL